MLAKIVLVVVATVLACAAALLNPTPAWACSCAPITTKQAYDDADAVFKGKVTRTDRTGRGRDAQVMVRFQVSRVFKGVAYFDQVVLTPRDGAGCGVEAAVGSTWVIFATQTVEGTGDRLVAKLTTNLCAGNLPGELVPSLLGRGQFPQPGSSDSEEKSITADVRVGRALTIVGLGALGLLLVGGLGLAFVWRANRPPAS
jgi:hypothetical protein